MLRVSVIIVGFNSKNYLEDCFNSLLESTILPFEILFLDNNSSDQSYEFVKINFPQITVIQNHRNCGFAEANNIGIKIAIKNGAEYVFLLNPDTLTDPFCLEELLKYADLNTILQPLVLIHKDGKATNLINTSGNYINYLGISYVGGYNQKNDNLEPKVISLVSGAAMFIPVKILNKIGLFDENFFMYMEDTDLSWRALIAGYEAKMIPRAKVWHKYHFSQNPTKFYYTERNRLLFIYKNFNSRTITLIYPMLILNEFLGCLFALKNGWFYKKVSIYSEIRKLKPHIKNEREKAIRFRIKSDKDLVSFIGSNINFSEVKIPGIGFYNFIISGYWNIIKRFI